MRLRNIALGFAAVGLAAGCNEPAPKILPEADLYSTLEIGCDYPTDAISAKPAITATVSTSGVTVSGERLLDREATPHDAEGVFRYEEDGREGFPPKIDVNAGVYARSYKSDNRPARDYGFTIKGELQTDGVSDRIANSELTITFGQVDKEDEFVDSTHTVRVSDFQDPFWVNVEELAGRDDRPAPAYPFSSGHEELVYVARNGGHIPNCKLIFKAPTAGQPLVSPSFPDRAAS
jgi:hypothetical protein